MTDEELQYLINYKTQTGNDNIQYKETIKKKLIENSKLIHSLNNKDLDPDCPDDYYGDNILPYILTADMYNASDTQTSVKHYICFETSFNEVHSYNGILKAGQIIFVILCDIKDIEDKVTGIYRHDLLAALITDQFNWSNDFGLQIQLVSDTPKTSGTQHIGRTLVFEQVTPNSIVKAGKVYNSAR